MTDNRLDVGLCNKACLDDPADAYLHRHGCRGSRYLRAVGACNVCPQPLTSCIPVITAQSCSLCNVIGKLLACCASWTCQDGLTGDGDKAPNLPASCQIVQDLQSARLTPRISCCNLLVCLQCRPPYTTKRPKDWRVRCFIHLLCCVALDSACSYHWSC